MQYSNFPISVQKQKYFVKEKRTGAVRIDSRNMKHKHIFLKVKFFYMKFGISKYMQFKMFDVYFLSFLLICSLVLVSYLIITLIRKNISSATTFRRPIKLANNK